MARPPGKTAVASLPSHLLAELERRIEARTSAQDITRWLEAEGQPISYQAIARHVRQSKAAAASTRSVVAFAEAAAESNAELDLISLANAKLAIALNELPPAWTIDLKPSELFLAIARMSTADIQRQKWQQALKDRMETELATVAGKPGIDLQTLKQVRETIYGIFD